MQETYCVWNRKNVWEKVEFQATGKTYYRKGRDIVEEKGWEEWEIDYLENYPNPDTTDHI